MSDEYEPVRAWTEWDAWSVYWQSVGKLDSAWFIPTAGDGLAYNLGDMSLASMIEGQALGGYALRSLRVLLRSGHWLYWLRGSERINWWIKSDPHDSRMHAKGNCSADLSDAEAVSRALAEARRWLEEDKQ